MKQSRLGQKRTPSVPLSLSLSLFSSFVYQAPAWFDLCLHFAPRPKCKKGIKIVNAIPGTILNTSTSTLALYIYI